MGFSFDSNIPIYIQVMEDIKIKIANGEYSINTRIEPVRELAIKYGVNPNTVQRALQELEKEELLHAERTSGRFITNDLERIDQCKTEMAEKYSEIYINHIQSLGLSIEEAIVLLQNEAMKRGVK